MAQVAVVDGKHFLTAAVKAPEVEKDGPLLLDRAMRQPVAKQFENPVVTQIGKGVDRGLLHFDAGVEKFFHQRHGGPMVALPAQGEGGVGAVLGIRVVQLADERVDEGLGRFEKRGRHRELDGGVVPQLVALLWIAHQFKERNGDLAFGEPSQ